MDKIIKKIFFWLQKTIIFYVSLFFAIFVVIKTIISGAWIYIILAAPLVIINFFLSKKFPNRFTPWFGQTRDDVYEFIMTPPISTIIISIALVVFTAHFFDPFAKEIWITGLDFLPILMNEFGMQIFPIFIFLPTLVILCFLTFFGLLKLFKKKLEIVRYKLLFYLIIAISAILYTYLLAKLIDATLGNEITTYSGRAISIIVGFIPIHWAYEIFIGSMFKKT